VAITLSEWISKGDWRLFYLHRDRVGGVTPADVKRVAGKYLVSSNRTVGMFIPTTPEQVVRAAVPPTPSVPELVKDYKGTQAVAAGEVFDPTPENIEARVKRFVPKGEGVKVAVLPKKTRGETVVLQLTLRYGNEKSLAGQTTAANLLGTMLMRGTEKYTRQQLQDTLDKLGTRMSVGGGTAAIHVSVETKREHLPVVLELIREVLGRPTFPASEFEILKRENRDSLQKALTEPTALAFRAVQRQLNPYAKDDIRYIPTYEEEIARLDAVSVEQLRQLYKQVSGQGVTVAVVGDSDVLGPKGELAPWWVSFVSFLENWKSGVRYVRIERPARTDTPGGKEVILTPDKANAMYVAGHNLAITDADPDYAALEIANFLLGGGTLSSRLGNRVRQKEGLSYGVASMFNADAKDKAGRLFMYAICNPANMPKVEAVMVEELQKLLLEGVSQAELDEAKKSWLSARHRQRSSDGALAGQLESGLFLDRTFAWHADLEKKVAGLTVPEVNAAMRKQFLPGKLVIIEAGDFKKK
jgi:zinc protease